VIIKSSRKEKTSLFRGYSLPVPPQKRIFLYSFIAVIICLLCVGEFFIIKSSPDYSKSIGGFIPNYCAGLTTPIKDVHIDIKFIYLQKLAYYYEMLSKQGFTKQDDVDEIIPAKMTSDDHMIPVQLDMHDFTSDDLGDAVTWPLSVTTDVTTPFSGMYQFYLFPSEACGFMYDKIFQILARERGLISPRSDFIQLSVNGRDLGLYFRVEGLNNGMIKQNNRVEGILFKPDARGISVCNDGDIALNYELRSDMFALGKLWENFMAGDTPAGALFDCKKMGRYYALLDFAHGPEVSNDTNTYLYFNPGTKLIEPVGIRWRIQSDALGKTRQDNPRKETEPLRNILLKDPSVSAAYHGEIQYLLSPEFLDNFIIHAGKGLKEEMNMVHKYHPFYRVPLDELRDHQRFLRSRL